MSKTPEKPIINWDFLKKRPLSYSSLKNFLRSPKHYLEYLISKYKPTPAMILGSLVDVMVLTPDKFEDTYEIVKLSMKGAPAKSEKHNDRWKEIKDKAKEEKKLIIFNDMYETAKECVKALNEHPQAKEMLDNMKRSQVRLTWKDTDTRLPMIGYVDFETTYLGLDTIVDLKTATNADPSDWGRTVCNFGYDLQGAVYLDGYHKSQYRFPEYYWLVVETSPPFGVSVNRFQPKDIEEAKETMFITLKAFKLCMDKKRFNQGYEFRLFETMPYHQTNIPPWKKKIYG